MDNEGGVIERIGIDGRGREIIQSSLGLCVNAMTIDFSSFTIFWLDGCTFTLESVRMDGVRTTSSISIVLSSLSSVGISVYKDFIVWSDSFNRNVRGVNTTVGNAVIDVSQTLLTVFGGVEVVHPDKQPNGEQIRHSSFYDIIGVFPWLMWEHMCNLAGG